MIRSVAKELPPAKYYGAIMSEFHAEINFQSVPGNNYHKSRCSVVDVGLMIKGGKKLDADDFYDPFCVTSREKIPLHLFQMCTPLWRSWCIQQCEKVCLCIIWWDTFKAQICCVQWSWSHKFAQYVRFLRMKQFHGRWCCLKTHHHERVFLKVL